MKPSYLALLLLLAPISACSGESAPVFEDPILALEQAEAAKASGKEEIAEQGFRFAAEHGDAEIKLSALLKLSALHASLGREEQAIQTFEEVLNARITPPSTPASPGVPVSLTWEQYLSLLGAAFEARLSDFGDILTVSANTALPEQRENLDKFDDAFLDFRKGLESDLDLSSMGYVED